MRADEEHEEDLLLRALRPRRLEEFIGQEKIKERLRLYLKAATDRERRCPPQRGVPPADPSRGRWATPRAYQHLGYGRAEWAEERQRLL